MRDDPARNGHDRSADRSRDRSAPEASGLDVSEIVDAIREQGRQILDATRTLASVQLDRARISLWDSLWAIGLVVVGGAVVITFACAAALQLLEGASDAIAAATGHTWSGPLFSGALGLVAVGLLLRRAGRVRIRRRAARLAQKYDVRQPGGNDAVTRHEDDRGAGASQPSRRSRDVTQRDLGDARPGGHDAS